MATNTVSQMLAKTSLRGNITESAANTYTETTIDTNLSIRGDHVFIVTGIWWQFNAAVVGTGDRFQGQIAYAKQTDIILLDDADWLFGQEVAMDVVTSGGGHWSRIKHDMVDHFPIAVGTLHLGCKGVGLSNAGQLSVKIEGYHQKVNTTEFFRLAQSR